MKALFQSGFSGSALSLNIAISLLGFAALHAQPPVRYQVTLLPDWIARATFTGNADVLLVNGNELYSFSTGTGRRLAPLDGFVGVTVVQANARGEAAGYSWNAGGTDNTPTRWGADGQPHLIPSVSGGQARAINQAGVIAGYTGPMDSVEIGGELYYGVGFSYHDGAVTVLENPNPEYDTYATIYEINENGTAVGSVNNPTNSSKRLPAIWETPTPRVLGLPPEATDFASLKIPPVLPVIGVSIWRAPPPGAYAISVPYLWKNDAYIKLPTMIHSSGKEGFRCYIRGLNDWGWMAGEVSHTNSENYAEAQIYFDGQWYRIENYLTNPEALIADYSLSTVSDLNNRNEILIQSWLNGRVVNNPKRVYLLRPVYQPGTYQAWAEDNFGTPLDSPARQKATARAPNQSVANAFLYGTGNAVGLPLPSLLQLEPTQDTLVVRWQRDTSAGDVALSLEYSTDLASGTWTPIPSPPGATDELVKIIGTIEHRRATIQVSGNRVFVRLVARVSTEAF